MSQSHEPTVALLGVRGVVAVLFIIEHAVEDALV